MASSGHVTSDSNPWSLPSQSRIWVGGHNLAARRCVESALSAFARPAESPLDAAFVTPMSSDEAAYFAAKLLGRLTPTASIWIVVDAGAGDWRELDDAMQALGLLKSATVRLGPQLLSEGFVRARVS